MPKQTNSYEAFYWQIDIFSYVHNFLSQMIMSFVGKIGTVR